MHIQMKTIVLFNYIRIKKGIQPKLHLVSPENLKKDKDVEQSGEESGEKTEKG